jgi:putative transposase
MVWLSKKKGMGRLFHCVYRLHYHMVFVTKYRRKALTEAMLTDMEFWLASICQGWGGVLTEFNGERDHVHMLVELPPTAELSKFVNSAKTATSRRLRGKYRDHLAQWYKKPVLWSRSYCVVSCGGAPLEILKQYIVQQDRPSAGARFPLPPNGCAVQGGVARAH